MGGRPRWLEGGSEGSKDEIVSPAWFNPESLEPLVVEMENDVQETANCDSPVLVAAEPGWEVVEVEAVGAGVLTEFEDVGEELERLSFFPGKVSQAGDIVGPTLHKLMHLRADARDQSSVEKIIMPPYEIEKFCNEAMLNSAEYRDGQTLLDFTALKNGSVHVVGLYGSKKVLVQIFSKLGFHTIVSAMLGSLEVGIYGFLHEGVLFIFYWHEGERMLEASGKDVSCNFIRYVTDLCATVYICLDDENDVELSRMTLGRSTAASSKQRTPRLKISVVRQSENDVKLQKGFHIRPLPFPEKTQGNGETSSCPQPSIRLAGGVYRCAFLTSSVVPPTKVDERTHQKVLEIQDLAGVVEEWSASFNLDFTQLPHRELCLFLEHAGLEGSKDYGLLRESFQARRNALTQRIHGIWERAEKQVLSFFDRAQKAYLDIYHPSPAYHGYPEVFSDPEGVESSEPIAPDLVHAEAFLFNLLTASKQQPSRSLLFVGTEFEMRSEGTKQRSRYGGKFIVLSISSARSSTLAGPILYGEEFVVRPKDAENQIKMTCEALNGDDPEGPVLPSHWMKFTIHDVSSQNQSVLKAELIPDRPSGKVMLAWMKSCGKLVMAPIIKRMAYLEDEYGNNTVQGAAFRGWFSRNAKKMLESSGLLSQFKERLAEDALGQMMDLCEYDIDSKVDADWDLFRDLLERVYREACAEFSCAVRTMVKKEICPMLRKVLRALEKCDANRLEQSFEREEREFVTRLQGQLSRGIDREHCLSVRRCFLQSGQKEARMSEGESCVKLEVHYVAEQTESEKIAWHMTELTPMKKDLEASMCDSGHLIVPKCSENHRYLLDVYPNSTRLRQVVAVKSGEVILLVEKFEQPAVHLFVLPRAKVQGLNPVKTFKGSYALVAVDEVSKLVGLYDRELARIEIHRLDDSFHPLGESAFSLNVSKYPGMRFLTSICFIPGRKKMVLVGEEFKVWVVEVGPPVMLRSDPIQLPGPAHKICVSTDGSCLMAFYKSLPDGPSEAAGGLTESSDQSEVQHGEPGMDESTEGFLKIEVYLLGESVSHLKTLLLDYAVADIKTIDATIVEFGSEVHLVLVDASRPDRGIWSEVIEITSASDVCQLQHVDRGSTAISSASFSEKVGHGCPALDYVYQIFEKYATSPPLIQKTRDLHLHLVFAGESKEKLEALKRSSVRYVNAYMDKLERDTGKDFSQLELAVSAGTVDSYILHNFLVESTEDRNSVNLGDWVQQLVCLVPIQLARAENNTLRFLVDGLQNPNLKSADAVGLAQALRFGFYDSVLAHWFGNIKVISSVGKESSGKSYLLNHLAGSLFDVAEERCTDGVWMTMRASESCLYVLLDFEGLGSLKRSEQEDMLLFTLNAAVSNFTIYNKKEAHLDTETKAVFKGFPKGLVKEDSRLFNGLFYMAIKDVDASDVDGLKARFLSKIQQICCESQANFLTKMYGGLVEIAAMPPFQRSEYHDSVVELAAAVEELEPVHRNGNTLTADLKVVMALLASKD